MLQSKSVKAELLDKSKSAVISELLLQSKSSRAKKPSMPVKSLMVELLTSSVISSSISEFNTVPLTNPSLSIPRATNFASKLASGIKVDCANVVEIIPISIIIKKKYFLFIFRDFS